MAIFPKLLRVCTAKLSVRANIAFYGILSLLLFNLGKKADSCALVEKTKNVKQ